ncbi:M48 family metallopeptidase [Segatella bryantii]|uniref:M48 family metallopeptidase n=1 Tax=Segatella bryantii TaxID=77095 RepID=UPI001EDBE217|nr:SprT family zinc-dependent metalloprotease [Segatella bryantii]UKK74069.1 M48 family metallopeptidase [Segatella bryantii]
MAQITRDHIQYGATIIDYVIEFAQRKTLSICVNPDSSVCLRAPIDATLEQIQQKVHKRASWILKQKRFFESFGTSTTKRQYISGELHLYLGRQYMLRVKESNVNAVHYQNNIIEIECRHKKDAGILLQTWYRQRANVKFQEYAQPIIEQFSIYGVKPQSLSIKKMDKRWGYCTIDGHITLNPRLICAPRCCIEYVITHELCHLIYRSHNKEFYALLTKEMPHWEKWKNKLERILM